MNISTVNVSVKVCPSYIIVVQLKAQTDLNVWFKRLLPDIRAKGNYWFGSQKTKPNMYTAKKYVKFLTYFLKRLIWSKKDLQSTQQHMNKDLW